MLPPDETFPQRFFPVSTGATDMCESHSEWVARIETERAARRARSWCSCICRATAWGGRGEREGRGQVSCRLHSAGAERAGRQHRMHAAHRRHKAWQRQLHATLAHTPNTPHTLTVSGVCGLVGLAQCGKGVVEIQGGVRAAAPPPPPRVAILWAAAAPPVPVAAAAAPPAVPAAAPAAPAPLAVAAAAPRPDGKGREGMGVRVGP